MLLLRSSCRVSGVSDPYRWSWRDTTGPSLEENTRVSPEARTIARSDGEHEDVPLFVELRAVQPT